MVVGGGGSGWGYGWWRGVRLGFGFCGEGSLMVRVVMLGFGGWGGAGWGGGLGEEGQMLDFILIILNIAGNTL